MSRLQPSVLERVRAFAADAGVFAGLTRVRAGFSGGADSTALVVVLGQLGVPFEAVHLHHGLRGAAADADAAWCRAFCQERGIPYVQADLEVGRQRRRGEGIEEAGRRLRLEYWGRTTPADQAVALGHHLDDGCEDLLLRLSRGANSSGLTALRPVTEIAGVRLVRPLLGLRRAEIEAFLRDQGLDAWRHDASNDSLAWRRNAIRHQWLPLWRRTVGHDQGLQRSLEALRADADCLEALARAALPAIRDPAALRVLHPALLPRLLRHWLRQETGVDWVPRRDAILRLQVELARYAGRPRRLPLARGRLLQLDAGGLHLVAAVAGLSSRRWAWAQVPCLELPEIGAELRAAVVPKAGDVLAPCAATAERFAFTALAPELEVRAWQAGDRLVPFGHTGATKLQDLFTDAHIGRDARRAWPVVLSQGTIVWVPGVRRAEFGRVQGDGPAVRLEWHPTRAAAGTAPPRQGSKPEITSATRPDTSASSPPRGR